MFSNVDESGLCTMSSQSAAGAGTTGPASAQGEILRWTRTQGAIMDVVGLLSWVSPVHLLNSLHVDYQ